LTVSYRLPRDGGAPTVLAEDRAVASITPGSLRASASSDRFGGLRIVGVPPYRDLAAFDDRARSYDQGWRGRLHHVISERTAALATATVAAPQHVLDVGCGTGYLLRVLAGHYPGARSLAGIDAAPNMIETAERITDDKRLTFATGVAEHLPYDDASMDLVVSSTSFDHWSDQGAGLAECARVLRPGGHLVLVDQFSRWLIPTLAVSRRSKARTRSRAGSLLDRAGFDRPEWHNVCAIIINGAVARLPSNGVVQP
jgi:ubiquinone/menaquinone biosynthesis C-methylase UbiE